MAVSTKCTVFLLFKNRIYVQGLGKDILPYGNSLEGPPIQIKKKGVVMFIREMRIDKPAGVSGVVAKMLDKSC